MLIHHLPVLNKTNRISKLQGVRQKRKTKKLMEVRKTRKLRKMKKIRIKRTLRMTRKVMRLTKTRRRGTPPLPRGMEADEASSKSKGNNNA